MAVFECNDGVGCSSHGGLGEKHLGLLGKGKVRRKY